MEALLTKACILALTMEKLAVVKIEMEMSGLIALILVTVKRDAVVLITLALHLSLNVCPLDPFLLIQPSAGATSTTNLPPPPPPPQNQNPLCWVNGTNVCSIPIVNPTAVPRSGVVITSLSALMVVFCVLDYWALTKLVCWILIVCLNLVLKEITLKLKPVVFWAIGISAAKMKTVLTNAVQRLGVRVIKNSSVLLERPNVLECQTKARYAVLVLTVIQVAVTAVAATMISKPAL